jgi:hypothetical protein
MGCLYSKNKGIIYYIVTKGHNNIIMGITLDYDKAREIYNNKEKNDRHVELIEVHISKESGLVTQTPMLHCHNYPYL